MPGKMDEMAIFEKYKIRPADDAKVNCENNTIKITCIIIVTLYVPDSLCLLFIINTIL